MKSKQSAKRRQVTPTARTRQRAADALEGFLRSAEVEDEQAESDREFGVSR